MKVQKKFIYFFFFLGGGGVGGFRVDGNGELRGGGRVGRGGGGGGGGGVGWGGQGRCEWRSKVFVKIQKKKKIWEVGGVRVGGGRVRVRGVRVDVYGEVKLL